MEPNKALVKKALVSIIIPVFNREAFLKETLNTVRSQTYPNWECILVDDQSTDDSLQILNAFRNEDSRFKVLVRPDSLPKGANSCRNFGLEESRGYYINWFDSDDLMHPNFIAAKVGFFDENTDVVISKTKLVDKEIKNVTLEKRTRLTANTLEDFITRKISWYLPDPMYRIDFLKNNKLKFKEYDVAAQDRDFMLHVLLCNPRVSIVDKYVTSYIKHHDSISFQTYKTNNLEVSTSRAKTLIEFIRLLRSRGKLATKLKNFYLIELRKLVPLTYEDRHVVKELLSTIFKLSSMNFETFETWGKIFIGLTSLEITGKGQKLFK